MWRRMPKRILVIMQHDLHYCFVAYSSANHQSGWEVQCSGFGPGPVIHMLLRNKVHVRLD